MRQSLLSSRHCPSGFIAILAMLLLQGCVIKVIDKNQPATSNNYKGEYYYYPLPPHVPDTITFAGQTVHFDKEDRIERMDRELMNFTYQQKSTLLILRRSGKIFPQIEPILRAEGVPDDLKYLAVIESSLNPGAISRAGAVGLWQFMQPTAWEYGLTVNDYIDERFNIEKETIAACRYLIKQYKKFGDWMTVAASYNAGRKGIIDQLDRQLAANGMDLWLVEETSQYMFRLLTAKMLFDNPDAFGFHVTEKHVYKYHKPKEQVTINTSISDLPSFAKEHNCSYVAFRRANLWIRADYLRNPAHKTYVINIPE